DTTADSSGARKGVKGAAASLAGSMGSGFPTQISISIFIYFIAEYMCSDVLGVPLLHSLLSLFFIDFIAGYMYPDVLGAPLPHNSRYLFFIDYIAGYLYPD